MDADFLRTKLRSLAGRVRPPEETTDTPPAPVMGSGPELERFRDPRQALTYWEDKQTQWWYFTGHLRSKCGRKFGYELVFFSRKTHHDYIGVVPGKWFKPHLFVAHFALADIDQPGKKEQFRYWHRGGFLSTTSGFAAREFFHVEVGGWTAFEDEDGVLHLRAQAEGRSIALRLKSSKPLVYHSEGGYSRRDDDTAVASYHCTYSRLETRGRLVIGSECFEVSGDSWMDHEKMLAARDRFINGWNWYSLQFTNGQELMVYQLRKADGSFDPKYSSGSLIDADSRVTHLTHEDFQIRTLRHWRSPRSGGRYPVHTELFVPRHGIELEVVPLVDQAELDCVKTSFVTYWEGPVRAAGRFQGSPVSAQGYLELCGYDERKSSKLLHFMVLPEPHF